MKKIKLIWLFVLLASSVSSFAIEGLQLSVQSSNVVLAWPSLTNETYIAQYRQTLSVTDSWLTLTDYFPAAINTNLTFFVHSNSVNYGYAQTSSGGGVLPPGVTNVGGFVAGTGFYRVVRDGVHVYGLTNGMVLSGEIQLPIEFAAGSTDQIVGVTFFDGSGSPLIGANAFGTNDAWTLDWNTPMSFNGDYNIYAELDFASDDSVTSAPVTVTIDNTISFPNYFSRVFGDQMWVYAQTIPDAAYELDIYDENTNYLGTFSDYADGGGYISFTWDLTDGNGNTFDSTNFYGVFTVDTSSSSVVTRTVAKKLNAASANFQAMSPPSKKTFGYTTKDNRYRPADGGSSSSAPQLWVKEPTWTPNNNWVIAYASLTGDAMVDQSATDMILGGPGEDTDYGGVIGTLDEYGLNGNLSPGNNGQGGQVFTLSDLSSRTNLLSYLADHRYENFYFFGHGNNSVISAYNASQTALTMQQIAFALVNVPLSYSILHAAEHPYRFIFIDACNTGKGNFCEAFGIPAITVSTNFFATAGVESRAFIGFTKPTGFDPSLSSGDPNGVPNRSITMAEFLDAWLHSEGDLNTILQDAENSFGQFGYKMDSSAVIYGAYDLKNNTRTRP